MKTKHVTKWFNWGFVLILSLSLLAGCVKKDNTGSAGLKIVRIGGIVLTELGGNATITQKLGYFEEELKKVGYKPEYSAFAQAGPALNEALSANAIDFGIYGDLPQLVLCDKGVNARAIAPITTEQHYALLVHSNSGIRSVKDLEGKKVIGGTGTVLQKIFEDLVAAEGADINKIHQLNALADARSVYASGEADAILSVLSSILINKEQSGGDVIFSTVNKPEWAAVIPLIGRGEFLDENPDAAKAIVRALYRAYEYAAADSAKAFEALTSERLPIALVQAIYGYDPSFSYFKPEFTSEAIARIEQTNDFLARQKLIDNKVDLTKFLDTKYYDAVRGEFER